MDVPSNQSGGTLRMAKQGFEVAPLGDASYDVSLAAPAAPGRYVLTVKAVWDGKPWSPTVTRRKVTVNP